MGDLTRASGVIDTSPNAQCEDCFDSWCLGATYCLLPAAHNVAENRIDFKRFICFGIKRARVGAVQNENDSSLNHGDLIAVASAGAA